MVGVRPGLGIRAGSDPQAIRLLSSAGQRIATAPEILAPNKSMLYRIPNATGYEAFYLAPIAFYTSASEAAASADGSRTYVRKWLTPLMSRLSVRYYVSSTPVPGAEPVYSRGATYVYENPAAEPLVHGAPAWTMLSPEHWTAQAPAEGTIALSQADYPGWKAWVDGRPQAVVSERGMFPQVRPPFGEAARADSPVPPESPPRVVHFRFLPETWFIGVWISLASLAFVLLTALRRGNRFLSAQRLEAVP